MLLYGYLERQHSSPIEQLSKLNVFRTLDGRSLAVRATWWSAFCYCLTTTTRTHTHLAQGPTPIRNSVSERLWHIQPRKLYRFFIEREVFGCTEGELTRLLYLSLYSHRVGECSLSCGEDMWKAVLLILLLANAMMVCGKGYRNCGVCCLCVGQQQRRRENLSMTKLFVHCHMQCIKRVQFTWKC